MSTRLGVYLGVCLAAASLSLQAQDVFVLPGANSNTQNVSVFTANPFTNLTSFTSGSGSYLVLPTVNGSKYFVIANSGSATVTVVDNTFSNPVSLGNLNTQASNAVMTPDGTKLLVAAGTLQVFNTATNANLTPGGGINVNATVFDVAASLDSSTAYILAHNGLGGSQLTFYDLIHNQPLSTLAISGNATGVALAPNGLIYVSTQNQILEINPNTFSVTQGGTIGVNALPGKLVFTPDGKYGVAVNQTPITGSVALLISLSSRSVANTIANFGGVTLSSLYVENSSTILAYSSQATTLYQVTISQPSTGTIPGFSIGGFNVTGLNPILVSSLTFSDEVGAGGRTTPQYLFILDSGVLFRLDPTNNTIGQQITVAGGGGALAYAAATSTGAPVTVLQYGDLQQLATNSVSNPLVVRALDNTGRPVSGATVTFSTSVAGAVVNPASAVTGSSGYAETFLTAPGSSGTVTVNATVGTQQATFTITVGSPNNGGGGNTAGGIRIVAGQGQITFLNFNTGSQGFGSPLTVLVTDANGKPVPNIPVTFGVTQGPGSVTSCPLSGNPNCDTPGMATGVIGQIQPITDTNGLASVGFQAAATLNAPTQGFDQSIVTASAANTQNATFYITTAQDPTVDAPTARLLSPTPGSTLTGQAGTILPAAISATVGSIRGIAIPNVSITILNAGGNNSGSVPGATCNDTTGQGVLTNSQGIVTCDLALNGVVGSATITPEIGYVTTFLPINLVITSGPPGVVRIVSGNNQSGKPGQQLPQAIVVTVSDSFGNLLPNTAVSFKVTSGSATLTNVSTSTDSNARASAIVTLGSTAGPSTILVTAGAATATFTATTTIPTAGLQKVSGDAQSALVNTQFASPLVVEAVDASGNPVNGVTVTFAVTSGSASVSPASATTGANGQASTIVTASSSSSSIVVTATSGTFSVTFNLTSRLPGPANVVFLNAASFQPGISPGSIALITGVGIATGVQGTVTPNNILGPLPTSLAGVSISFGGVLAPIYYVSNISGKESVAVQVPFETPVGSAQVVINSAGGGSGTFTAQIAQYSPGMFTTTYGVSGLAAPQVFIVAVDQNGNYITPNNPAIRGQIVTFFVTGIGQTSPATATGSTGVGQTAAVVPLNIAVGINNGGVRLVSAVYSPGLVGVYSITLQIPANTTPGPAQPVGLFVTDSAGNNYFAQGANIPIQ